MNKGKRILAVLMMMTLAFSLCACGDTSKKLIGKWDSTLDYTSELKSQLGSDYDDLDTKFELTMLLEFKEDGTYSLSVDEESAASALDQVVDDLVAYDAEKMYASYEENGMTRAQVDEVAQQQYGCTLEEYLQEAYAESLDPEEMVSDMQTDGVYEAKGNKLFMDEEEVSPDTYDVFTIKGDILTIDIPEGAEVDEDEMVEGIEYPLTFTKMAE